MSELCRRLDLITGEEREKEYQHRGFRGRESELQQKLASSCLVYVGNLSFFTTEEQIHDLFSRAGPVRRIIMGLNRVTKSPCGFCFVEYFTRAATDRCVQLVNGCFLDGRAIRVDIDPEFSEERRYGRGFEGGQVRDEIRRSEDIDRAAPNANDEEGTAAAKRPRRDNADAGGFSSAVVHGASDSLGSSYDSPAGVPALKRASIGE
jgi:nuclear cap-binding protein subunit 2